MCSCKFLIHFSTEEHSSTRKTYCFSLLLIFIVLYDVYGALFVIGRS